MKEFDLEYVIIDLTHAIDEDIPTWEGECGCKTYVDMNYPNGARVLRYELFAGIGTHMDAPSHVIKDGASIDDIDAAHLFVKACVIDVSNRVQDDGDYLVSCEDIAAWEFEHGEIESGSVFLAYTGWSRFWFEPEKYRNIGQDGKLHIPGFSLDAADLLLARNIVGIGLDTLSPDGAHYGLPVHHKILGAGKYIIENIANLDSMPRIGAYVCIAPLKIKHGTEAPIRMLGFMPKSK